MVIQFQINLVVELTENYSILKGKKKNMYLILIIPHFT